MKKSMMLVALVGVALAIGGPLVAQVEESSMPATEEPAEESAGELAEEGPPVLMTPAWAMEACEAWNGTTELTTGLTKWILNDKERGFKVIQLYRLDCEESPRIELRLEEQEGEVMCVYGGAIETEELEPGADYVMTANTDRWLEMGAGEYGPMKGMMTGRLKFKGPKFEAMRNMGPFKGFLLLVGEVPGDPASCPAA